MSNKHIRSMEMREAVDGKTMAKGIGNVRKWNKFGLLTTAPSLCSFYSILFAIIWCKYVDFVCNPWATIVLSLCKEFNDFSVMFFWLSFYASVFFLSERDFFAVDFGFCFCWAYCEIAWKFSIEARTQSSYFACWVNELTQLMIFSLFSWSVFKAKYTMSDACERLLTG